MQKIRRQRITLPIIQWGAELILSLHSTDPEARQHRCGLRYSGDPLSFGDTVASSLTDICSKSVTICYRISVVATLIRKKTCPVSVTRRENDGMAERQIRRRLSSPFHERLLRSTYDSITARVEPYGFFRESVTGAYDGMFARTIGALGRLFLQTGEEDKLEKVIDYCLSAMIAKHMERIPHVIDNRNLASGSHQKRRESIPIISDIDQIDGQAHVILVWAMLAKSRGLTEFEERTYPVIAKLMNRSITPPYLASRSLTNPGLICNTNLEHSRERRMWHAFDFLTQSFVASALENMISVAERRGDRRHAGLWSHRLQFLSESVTKKMTRKSRGKRIYMEMLLPTDRGPEPFPGLGWLNLAPIPSGWKGVDPDIFRNTIETWHRVARIDWEGPRATSSDWLPEGHRDNEGRQMSNEVIGKVLAWDLVYCFETGDYESVSEMLDFIKEVNADGLYAESFRYEANTKRWCQTDPGNGEQAGWWCWAMMVLREKLGLPTLPPSVR